MSAPFVIGKLRRPHLPAAPITYEVLRGIRVGEEVCPADPLEAAKWCRRVGGWVRLRVAAVKSDIVDVQLFIAGWRRG